MSDMQFPCPQCHQNIQCDEQFAGQDLQCPLCQNVVKAPGGAVAPAAAAAHGTKTGTRLSLGAHTPSAPTTNSTLQTGGAPLRVAKKKTGLLQMAGIGICVVAALAAGAYGLKVSGYGERLGGFFAKSDSSKSGETKPADASAAPAPAGGQAQASTPAPAPAPAPAAVPEIPPVWSMDLSSVEFPKGPPVGMVSGGQFKMDSVRLDKTVLVFKQGTGPAVDRDVMIYLPIKAGEDLSGKKWTVAKEDRLKIPQVAKRWVTNPKFAPATKPFATGYAMRLEFGENKNGEIKGQIYLSLPDTEQSFVAGSFVLSTDPNVAAAAQAAASQPITTVDKKMADRYGLKQ